MAKGSPGLHGSLTPCSVQGPGNLQGGIQLPPPLHGVMDKGSAVCLSPPALVSLGFQVQLLVKESYGVRVEALSPELNTS